MHSGLTLLNFRKNGRLVLGIRTSRGVLDGDAAASAFGVAVPDSTDAVIRSGAPGLKEIADRAITDGSASLFLREDSIEFAPSVAQPGKILCVGLNYLRHAQETKNPIPNEPILFGKFSNALNHHGGEIRVSTVPAEQFDYEAELVVVMGRRASHVAESDALLHVFGYSAGNDFSARDLQRRSTQWLIGKTCDGFAPLGPYLVTADLVPNPDDLAIECRVNGEVRQSSRTSDMIFRCAKIITYASSLMTLEPGDVIFTGTPEGVILGLPKEERRWLRPGDRIEVSVEQLGCLQNVVA